jgi:hypothetical protein
MKRYIPLLSLFLLAQCSSIYYENAFPRMLKTELKLVENAEADTVYVIYFNATVHGSDRVFPHVLWYHTGDSLVAYKIKPFCTIEYILKDSFSFTPSIDILSEEKCFDGSGWDLLHFYVKGNLVHSNIIDQECIMNSCAETALHKLLQHDFALMQKYISEWIMTKTIRQE